MSKRRSAAIGLVLVWAASVLVGPAFALQQKRARGDKADPYADYVWPPPPAKPRIKLERLFESRRDIEGESKLRKFLIGSSPKTPWDVFLKPQAVDFDNEGRILVTDWGTGALIRVDLADSRWDILGVSGAVTLQRPIGLDVGPNGTIFVADVGRRQIVAFQPDGDLAGLYGDSSQLQNPTDVAVSRDGRRLFVTDSKAQKIVVFDAESGARLSAWGSAGGGPGQFVAPTSVTVNLDGDLLVVDQLNARVQLFSAVGDALDSFGSRGTAPGQFVRPKDVSVDEVGFIYVTDFAFNNIQIFDLDFTLLTFVGSGGRGLGRFRGLSGVATHGDLIATADQLGRNVKIFRWIASRAAD